jgi:hypothetical protein
VITPTNRDGREMKSRSHSELDFTQGLMLNTRATLPRPKVTGQSSVGYISMRLVRALQFLFLVLLALVLFGGEVVESACCVDDVSNDYIRPAASSVQKFAKNPPAHVLLQRSINLKEELVLPLSVVPSIEPDHSAGSDRLRLTSIQRE